MDRRRNFLKILATLTLSLLIVTDAFGRAGGGGGYHSSGGGGGGGGGFHSSGGSGHGGSGLDVVYMIVWMFSHPILSLIIIAVIYLIYRYGITNVGSTSAGAAIARDSEGEKQRALAELRSHDPYFSEEQFIQRVSVAFEKIQAAWCAQDLRTVRPFISDGVHERFQLQFDEQKAEGYRDHMADIRIDSADIVTLASPGVFDEMAVRIRAAARDWRESLIDGSRLSGSTGVEPFTEIWTFLRRRGAVTDVSKVGLIEGNCPNCGAPIEMNQSANCTNCKAILRSGEYDWVLTEITQASEWRARRTDALPGVAELRRRDPDFDAAALEDRASVIYWRRATADRTGRMDALAKVALPRFVEMYAAAIKSPAGTPRRFIADSAVGSVETLGVFSADGWDRALVEVRSLGHWFLADPQGRIRNTGQEVWASTMFVLARKSDARSDAAKGVSSAHCPNCGAPESESASSACEFCGTILNDGSHDWVLEDVRDKNDPAAGEWFRRMQSGGLSR